MGRLTKRKRREIVLAILRDELRGAMSCVGTRVQQCIDEGWTKRELAHACVDVLLDEAGL
jgi:hypothetical protein